MLNSADCLCFLLKKETGAVYTRKDINDKLAMFTDLEKHNNGTALFQTACGKVGILVDPRSVDWDTMNRRTRAKLAMQKLTNERIYGQAVTDDMLRHSRALPAAEKTAAVNVDLNIGDTILTGRFKNSPKVVKSFGVDDKNQPTVNGRPALNFRIKKLMPVETKEGSMTSPMGSYGFTRLRNVRVALDKIAVSQGLYNAVVKGRLARQIAGYGTNPSRTVDMGRLGEGMKKYILRNRDASTLKAVMSGPVSGQGSYKGLMRNANIRSAAARNVNRLTSEAMADVPWYMRPYNVA